MHFQKLVSVGIYVLLHRRFMWASIIHLRLEIKDEYKPLNRACVPQIITFTNLTLYVCLSAVRNH